MKNLTLRIITGLLVILIGVAFLLSNLDILSLSGVFGTWWPMFIVAAGVIMLISSVRSYMWASLVIALGVIFQLNVLEVIDVNPWQLLWPAVIIFVGISIMANHSRTKASGETSENSKDDTTAIFGGIDKKVTSSDFKGGKLTLLFGGAKVDLSEAVIKKEATLSVTAFCGGAEIIVPKNVIVKSRITPLLGGVEDSTSKKDSSKDSPVLYIAGDLIMSGVEIKN
jgi:predicted membrane protein